ncbi:pyrroline-5-carboxylate reductase [Evansella clarkii]|uniref:pyrroline-5-carboxylate reductase n=1 Tax=Evansella clarkii TaxID=79879 RepID=UPI0030B81D28
MDTRIKEELEGMKEDSCVTFIGAGNMAEAIISGVVKKGQYRPEQLAVTNKNNMGRLIELQDKYGVQGIARDRLPISSANIIILAVKPKDAEEALWFLRDRLQPDQLVISVMAGISISYLEAHLSKHQPIIRTMPNTSGMILESATALSPGQHVTMKNVNLAKSLFKAIGEVYVIEEEQMDLFTGMAGSGPAFFYYLVEHIEKKAVENGMDSIMAREIGAQTILGAAKMLLERSEPTSQLRKNITSKNGTTEAGLEALSRSGGGEALMAAIEKAMNRSKEISKELEQNSLEKNRL